MTSFDLQPHLVGELLVLRPLKAEDWEGVFRVAGDPLVWEQHPARDRYKENVFREFFRDALSSGGALVALNVKTGGIIGSSRYFGHVPERSEIEIGWTFLGRAYWGGKYNGEMKRLMLDHAFRFVENVIFLVGATNVRSRRAMERIGGRLTDRVEKRSIAGEIVEHVVYQIRRVEFSAARNAAADRSDVR